MAAEEMHASSGSRLLKGGRCLSALSFPSLREGGAMEEACTPESAGGEETPSNRDELPWRGYTDKKRTPILFGPLDILESVNHICLALGSNAVGLI